MKIGIDISQIAYQGTGVAEYTEKLVENLQRIDKENEYVLFFSSLKRKFPTNFKFLNKFQIPNSRFQIKTFKFPLSLLDFIWNRLHVCPIEWFIGRIDVFLSSDWVQPPSKRAKMITVVHDLTPWKYPETLHSKIVNVHKRRMKWVKKECKLIICDSECTKKDMQEILKFEDKKLEVIYPGAK